MLDPAAVKVLHDQVLTPLEATPRVPELALIQLQGCPPGSTVRVGPTEAVASPAGYAIFNDFRAASLNGYVGILDVEVNGVAIGTIEVVPAKMSKDSYLVLLAELRAVWGDLVVDSEGARAMRVEEVESLHQSQSSAASLFSRAERPIRAALEHPAVELTVERVPARAESVNSPLGLTASVVRNMAVGRVGWSRRLVRKPSESALNLVADTLRTLAQKAADEGDVQTLERCRRLLGHRLIRDCRPGHVVLSWVIRSDIRYRRILDVRKLLKASETTRIIGPQEVEFGVRALPKLFEYWVFLRTLLEVERALGRPESGYDHLARPLKAGRFQLEIQPGTTVRYPGGVLVAYSPEIGTNSGWQGLRLAPHPLLERGGPKVATPDVVVLSEGSHRSAVVIDAKYVAEHNLDHAATKIHQKYGRIIHQGAPVVRSTWVAHPHARFERWAGYGMIPAGPEVSGFSLDLLGEVGFGARRGSVPPVPEEPGREHAEREVVILLDQSWSKEMLEERRIDLDLAKVRIAAGRQVRSAIVVVPPIAALDGFEVAARSSGWRTYRTKTALRSNVVRTLFTLVKSSLARGLGVVVVSDLPDIREICSGLDSRVEWFTDLASLPDVDTGFGVRQRAPKPMSHSSTLFIRRDEPTPSPVALLPEESAYVRGVAERLDGHFIGYDGIVEFVLRSISTGEIYQNRMLSGGVLLSDFGSILKALESHAIAMPNREGTLLQVVERIIADSGIDPPLEVVKNYELDTHVVVLFGSRPF